MVSLPIEGEVQRLQQLQASAPYSKKADMQADVRESRCRCACVCVSYERERKKLPYQPKPPRTREELGLSRSLFQSVFKRSPAKVRGCPEQTLQNKGFQTLRPVRRFTGRVVETPYLNKKKSTKFCLVVSVHRKMQVKDPETGKIVNPLFRW